MSEDDLRRRVERALRGDPAQMRELGVSGIEGLLDAMGGECVVLLEDGTPVRVWRDGRGRLSLEAGGC